MIILTKLTQEDVGRQVVYEDVEIKELKGIKEYGHNI
jgi:hypothetical protein